MASRKVKEGTKGTCRNCDRSLVYGRRPRMEGEDEESWLGLSLTWCHSDEDDAIKARVCNSELKTTYGSIERAGNEASPKEFCMEVTQGDSWEGGKICHKPVTYEEFFACGVHGRKLAADAASEAVSRNERNYRNYIIEGIKTQVSLVHKFIPDLVISHGGGYGRNPWQCEIDIELLLGWLEEKGFEVDPIVKPEGSDRPNAVDVERASRVG